MPVRFDIQAISKSYGSTVGANKAITLQIQRGEVFGLLGPNGAGKSTLVRQMVGLLKPDSGEIFYGVRPVREALRDMRRELAYLSQRPLALLDLTVREALEYTGRLRGLSPKQAQRQAGVLLPELELLECRDRVVGRLSGGQHRLVALGSALMGDTETLVLDEPTTELDPEVRRRVWMLLQERSRQGTTVVLVTHNALEAEQVIDRLAVLVSGRVIASGTPGSIKAGVDNRVRVELTFRTAPNGNIGTLRSLGKLTRLPRNRLVVSAPRADARRLIDGVLAAVPLETLDDFRVLTPTLEDVYLEVAAGTSSDSEAIS